MRATKQESEEQRSQLAIWIEVGLLKKVVDYAHKFDITKREVIVSALELFFGKEEK